MQPCIKPPLPIALCSVISKMPIQNIFNCVWTYKATSWLSSLVRKKFLSYIWLSLVTSVTDRLSSCHFWDTDSILVSRSSHKVIWYWTWVRLCSEKSAYNHNISSVLQKLIFCNFIPRIISSFILSSAVIENVL